KILRLNTDGSIPATNPVINGSRTHVYAYGLRNPFRLTFTPTGGLLVADVGAAAFEEVNKVTAGGNYGWPSSEGVCTSSCTGKTDP
ncbi:PKD domain-containing protein, partial [Mycobacterium sp. ITM-2017-0098]